MSNASNTNADTADAAQALPTKRSPKLVWPTTKKPTGVSGKFTYPFLDTSNLMDQHLVRILNVERPYKAPYGSTTKAWESCVQYLKDQKDEDNNPIFNADINIKALQTRLDKYIKFVKEDLSSVPFRSGEDNEEAPNSIRQGIEDIYEDWLSFTSITDSTRQSSVAAKANNRANANAIKQAAVTGFARKRNNHTDDSDNNNSNDDLPSSKKSKRSNSKSSRNSTAKSTTSNQSIFDSLQGLEIYSMKDKERKLAKAKHKVEKQEQKRIALELEQQKIKLEEKKLKLEEAKQKQSAKLMKSMTEMIPAQARTLANIQSHSSSQSSTQSTSQGSKDTFDK